MIDEDEIEVDEGDDGTWTVTHPETGIEARGPTKGQALAYLEDGLEMYAKQVPSRFSDKELKEMDIDPDIVEEDAHDIDYPWSIDEE
jgi:hypothetical protein